MTCNTVWSFFNTGNAHSNLYASELWGQKEFTSLDKILLKFAKYTLEVPVLLLMSQFLGNLDFVQYGF